MVGIIPPRDFLLPTGNEMIEATMSQRSRWFEFIAYRPLLELYYQEDPNFIWSATPMPHLTDDLCVEGYWEEFAELHEKKPEELVERTKRHQLKNTEVRPIWDDADAKCVGKDIFNQLSTITNRAGIDGLKHLLGLKGLRVHTVTFAYPIPWHIDTTIFFPREAVLFQNPNWLPIEPEFHELLRIDSWEIVNCAPAAHIEPHPWCDYSVYLAYNVFSMDPKTICVEATEVHRMEQLDQYGFEVVPAYFFDIGSFGGGLHCATVDLFCEGN